MEKALTITGVSGWALPNEWFKDQIEKYFPSAIINVLYPPNPGDSQEAEHLLKSAKADLYIGYSLGSLWLMTYYQMLPLKSKKAVLAPILAFSSERDRGGVISDTNLKYLIRQLKRNPKDPSPVREFYSNSEIQISNRWLNEVPENVVLLNGLEFLHTAPVPDIKNFNAIALVGGEDKLLDGEKLQRHFPRLEIIPSANHAPDLLLKRLAYILDLSSNE
jgi:hypothetical protein